MNHIKFLLIGILAFVVLSCGKNNAEDKDGMKKVSEDSTSETMENYRRMHVLTIDSDELPDEDLESCYKTNNRGCQIEQGVFAKINAFISSKGINTFSSSKEWSFVARQRSKYMIIKQSISHDGYPVLLNKLFSREFKDESLPAKDYELKYEKFIRIQDYNGRFLGSLDDKNTPEVISSQIYKKLEDELNEKIDMFKKFKYVAIGLTEKKGSLFVTFLFLN